MSGDGAVPHGGDSQIVALWLRKHGRGPSGEPEEPDGSFAVLKDSGRSSQQLPVSGGTDKGETTYTKDALAKEPDISGPVAPAESPEAVPDNIRAVLGRPDQGHMHRGKPPTPDSQKSNTDAPTAISESLKETIGQDRRVAPREGGGSSGPRRHAGRRSSGGPLLR